MCTVRGWRRTTTSGWSSGSAHRSASMVWSRLPSFSTRRAGLVRGGRRPTGAGQLGDREALRRAERLRAGVRSAAPIVRTATPSIRSPGKLAEWVSTNGRFADSSRSASFPQPRCLYPHNAAARETGGRSNGRLRAVGQVERAVGIRDAGRALASVLEHARGARSGRLPTCVPPSSPTRSSGCAIATG